MAYKRMPSKGISAMDKAIPKNDRFAHIQSSLNTGSNVNKVKTVTAREYAKRRNEIFYRITKKQLTELLEAYEQEEQENVQNNDYDSSPGGNHGPRIVSHSENQLTAYDAKPYLLLDARDPGCYRECHLVQARSFPLTIMKRDQMHPEIYQHRNKEEHLIVVYCDDERVSIEAAKFLVDRGTLNVFLLSGGMQDYVSEYADYVEGVIPFPGFKDNVKIQRTPTKSYRHNNSNQLGGINEDGGDEQQSGCSSPRRYSQYSSPNKPGQGHSLTHNALKQHNMMLGGSSRSGASMRSEAGYTNQTGKSVAESVISRATARKGMF